MVSRSRKRSRTAREYPEYFKRQKRHTVRPISTNVVRPSSIDVYSKLIKTPSMYIPPASGFTRPSEPEVILPIDTLVRWNATEAQNALLFLFKRHESKGAVLSRYNITTKHNYIHFLDYYTALDVPSDIVIQYWRNLMYNQDIKIVFILTQVYTTKNEGHANWIIIDKVRKVVEFFDPHGSYVINDPLRNDWNMNLVENFMNRFWCKNKTSLSRTECFIPRKYTVSTYQDSCPLIGFQGYEMNISPTPDIDQRGYCMIWSIFMMDLRLGNLHMTTKQVQNQYINLYRNIIKNIPATGSPASGTMTLGQLRLGRMFKDFIRNYVIFIQSLIR